MTDDPIAQFERAVLKGQPMPADLGAMLKLQLERASKAGGDADPLQKLGCRILLPGETHSLLSHDYLTENDRANPDIMDNVAAIDAVTALCSFVATTINDDAVGYWHGPDALAIADAPIVKLDTEGQFSLLHGRHLAEALVGDRVFDDDAAFKQYRDAFAALGIAFHADKWDALAEPAPGVRPDVLHHRYYNEARAKRGLPALD